jgi:hypothetical protein
MKRMHLALFCGALALASAGADAQTPMRVRGTITAIDGNVVSVKLRDGQDVKLHLADDVGVAVARPIKFEDIKQGDYVGVTTQKRADGALIAREVHYLAPTVPQGHIPWDLEPGSMMTNANVDAMVSAAGNHELTLKYKDGMQKVVVPQGVPIVRAVPGNRSDLKPGEYVFAVVQVAPDGKITAPRIQVSKDGVKPPQ